MKKDEWNTAEESEKDEHGIVIDKEEVKDGN